MHDAIDIFFFNSVNFVMKRNASFDIGMLNAFSAVCDAKSVTRAAEALNLTQSAVSWKIKRLEERIGRPLIFWRGRELNLTEDGKILQRHAQEISAAHSAAWSALRRSDIGGELRVGLTEETINYGVAEVASRFARFYPRISLSLRIDQSLTLTRALSAEEIDLAVLQVADRDLTVQDAVLSEDELIWVAKSALLLEHDPLPIITFGADCFYSPIVDRLLKESARTRRTAVLAPTIAGVIAALETGLGVGVLTKKAAKGTSLMDVSRKFPRLPHVKNIVRTDGKSKLKTALKQMFVESAGAQRND
jgi:DNA-binding transcriptional LysR family regulator